MYMYLWYGYSHEIPKAPIAERVLHHWKHLRRPATFVQRATSADGRHRHICWGSPGAASGGDIWMVMKSESKIIKRWCPPVINWFINPKKSIDISAINHSEIGVINQLNAILGAPPCSSWWSTSPDFLLALKHPFGAGFRPSTVWKLVVSSSENGG